MFVTVHRIFSLPVSLPVRGADGLAKRATYGGIERQRLSSQFVKAHLYGGTGLDTTMSSLADRIGEAMSVRSAMIGERKIAPALVRKGMTEATAAVWGAAIMALFQSGKAKEDTGREEGEDGNEEATAEAGRQILVLGNREIDAFVSVALAMNEAGISPMGRKADKKKGTEKVPGLRDLIVAGAAVRKKLAQPVQHALAALDAIKTHVGLDGAMFGRMATGVAVSRVDSAVHVGHALTVHSIQSAADERMVETGTAGRGYTTCWRFGRLWIGFAHTGGSQCQMTFVRWLRLLSIPIIWPCGPRHMDRAGNCCGNGCTANRARIARRRWPSSWTERGFMLMPWSTLMRQRG